MRELTKEQAIEEHRKMWRWIAEETEKRQKIVHKEDYFKEYFPAEIIFCNCFCCEYAVRISGISECKFCPIDWDSKYNHCMCMNKNFRHDGLYSLWGFATSCDDWKEAAELARQIAELPERKLNK